MRSRLIRLDAVIAITYTAVPICVSAVAMAGSGPPRAWLSLQPVFLLGALATALGLAAAIWMRVLATLALSAVALLTGALSLVLMTVLSHPLADRTLSTTGVWTREGMPAAAGWDCYVMSGLLLLAGAALPFTCGLNGRRAALLGMTAGRVSLWFGALWQLGYFSLGGDFAMHFFADTAGLQFALAIALMIGCLLLLRGDRRWLGALTAFDHSVALARFITPLTLMPIVASGVLIVAARQRGFSPHAAPVLNAELNSVVLLCVGLAAVRGIWFERRRRSTLTKALESSPIMIHSDQGLVEYWPRGCETLFGFTAADALGRRAADLLQTEYPIPLEEVVAIIRRTGEWVGEVRQRTRDGRRLWIATRVARDRPDPDSELKLVETMTDLTDLKLSKAALRDTIDSLHQVVAGYGLGMIDYRPVIGQVRFSPQMERMLGLEEGALGSDQSSWLPLIHPADVTRLTDLLADDVRRKSLVNTVIFKVMHRDGHYRDLQGVLRYDYDSEGRHSRIAGVYMDVTEMVRDRMEVAARGARLLELQTELNQNARLSAMGELSAGLAHELNQPLAAIGSSVGGIELMLRDDEKPIDGPMRERLRRAARHAETQTVRAGEIVRRLREFIARSEADTQVEHLATLVDDALALALPNPAAAQVKISKSIVPAAATVLADRIQIQQVMVNLIRNAVEAMVNTKKPRVLRIAAEARDGMALVRVIDNGPGVAGDGNSLFSPFISTKREGMGVGLFISRRIIESHGGKLWFEPVEGGGAEFQFTLPLAMVDAPLTITPSILKGSR